MKNNKGITLTSLVIYITLIFVILAILMRITTYFSGNIKDMADVDFETEFNKLNLYLLEESKEVGNEIEEIIGGTTVSFSNGNKYSYNSGDKVIYLNDSIKVCENVENCSFGQKTALNEKTVLVLTITIDETTKTQEYTMLKNINNITEKVDVDEYLWGGSLASYYLKAGDYVDYTPTVGTYTVASGANGSGYTSNQSFETDSSLKWRILSIDEETGEIELVSATSLHTLYLEGADGYNHAVDILNDLCEELYSKENANGEKIATARSINVEDINAKTTYNPKEDGIYSSNYGTEYKYSTFSTTDRKYPNLYVKEDGYYEGGIKKDGGITGSIGLNDGVIDDTSGVTTYSTVTGYTDDNDATKTKDISVTYTVYFYDTGEYLDTNQGINTAPAELLKTGTDYWLASRCVGDNNAASFVIRGMSSVGYVFDSWLFDSTDSARCSDYAVRPVVTLPVDLFDFSTGDGSEEEPWGMK